MSTLRTFYVFSLGQSSFVVIFPHLLLVVNLFKYIVICEEEKNIKLVLLVVPD